MSDVEILIYIVFIFICCVMLYLNNMQFEENSHFMEKQNHVIFNFNLLVITFVHGIHSVILIYISPSLQIFLFLRGSNNWVKSVCVWERALAMTDIPQAKSILND